MANYIDKDILCQAYIHIDPVPIGKDEYAEFKTHIENFLQTRGQFFIYDEIDSSVELKDGSLKIYATILGSLYLAISQYGSFRSGVDYLATDVKRLSDSLVSESLFLSKSRHQNILRSEARIGVVGLLKQNLDEIDNLKTKNMNGELSPNALAERLEALRHNIIRVIDKLKAPQDEPYIKSNLKEYITQNIAPAPFPQPNREPDKEAIANYQHERKELLGIVSR